MRPRTPEYERRYTIRKALARTALRDKLVRDQDGLCAWCGYPLVDLVHIDHNHDCHPGKHICRKCTRGAVHPQCNTAIGYIERAIKQDLVVATPEAADYLAKGSS